MHAVTREIQSLLQAYYHLAKINLYMCIYIYTHTYNLCRMQMRALAHSVRSSQRHGKCSFATVMTWITWICHNKTVSAVTNQSSIAGAAPLTMSRFIYLLLTQCEARRKHAAFAQTVSLFI